MRAYISILMMFLFIGVSVQATTNNDADTSSEDLKKELIEALNKWAEAWNTRNIDSVIEITGDAVGYGRRTVEPRDKRKEDVMRDIYEKWLDMMEVEELILKKDPIVYVVGDTGLVLTAYVERSKPKGGEMKIFNVRCSFTFVRSEGKWKMVLYHRDMQHSK